MRCPASYLSMIEEQRASDEVLVSGGLQQLLIKERNNEMTEQPRRGAGSDVTTFHDLAVSAVRRYFLLSYIASGR